MGNKWAYFPAVSACLLCGAGCARSLCPACRRDLPYSKKACPTCAQPAAKDQTCTECRRIKPVINQCIVMYDYRYPVDILIRQMKFRQRPEIIRSLGQGLHSRINRRIRTMPDVLVPVPLHKYRMLHRGYNQALELARILSRCSGIPVDHKSCWRIQNSPPQTRVPAILRRKNVRDVFRVTEQIHYRHVMIVDDVITTGSTVNEIAALFLQAGARYVSACALARAGTDSG